MTVRKDFDDVSPALDTQASHPISRRTLLKGAAAVAGAAIAAPAASLAGPGSAIAAPYINRAPEGQIVIWDRAGDLFQVFDAVIPSFNKKYPGITVKHVAVDVDSKLPTTLATGVNLPDGAFYEDNNLAIQSAHYYDPRLL